MGLGVQRVNGGLRVGNVECLHVGNLTETCDLAVDREAGGFKHGLPGIVLGACHVVVGVVAGDDHQRTEHDVGVAGRLDGLDDRFAGGLFGLTLDGADEDVLIAERLHLRAHLAVGDLRNVRGAVAHEDERGARFLRGVEALKACVCNSGGCDGLGDGFLVGVDDGSVRANLAEHRLCDGDGFKLVAVSVDHFAHFVIFCAVHQVGRLDDEVLHAVCDRTLERLIHVVDLFAVTGLDVVDDDLRGEGAADGPVGVRFLQRIFNALDVSYAAVVEGRAEGDDEQLVFADLVLISGIVLRCVAGVKTEVIGAGLFAFNERLLFVGQSVPRGLCGISGNG